MVLNYVPYKDRITIRKLSKSEKSVEERDPLSIDCALRGQHEGKRIE